jgi:hypothetical protein
MKGVPCNPHGGSQCICRKCPAPCQVIGCNSLSAFVVDEGDRAASEALGNVFDLYDYGTHACAAHREEVESWCVLPVTITEVEHLAKRARERAEMQATIEACERTLREVRGQPGKVEA